MPGDTNGVVDVFVHDRDADGDGIFDETDPGARATVRVSVASDGSASQGGNSAIPSIGADGRVVAFASGAFNLVGGDSNFFFDVFVHDRDVDGDGVFDEPGAVTTVRVSVAGDGSEANDDCIGAFTGLSADGRFMAIESAATNLVLDDTNAAGDVFVARTGR